MLFLFGLTVGTEFKTTYQYEPERNLKTQIKNEFGSRTVSQYDYEYNEQGSRTSLVTDGSAFGGVIPGPDAQVADYMTNSLNQYTDITTTVNSDQQVTDSPKYDDDGNLTEVSDYPGSLKYSYNAENRLVSAAPELPMQGDIKVEFVYDYMGRRVKKTVSVWNGSWVQETEKLFVYDGWNMICEITVPADGFATEKYYVWGLDLSQSLQGAGGIGGLIATLDNSASVVYYYFYDANGNVGQLANAADGSIAAHYEYDPFGNIIKAEGEYRDSNPYHFSTKYFDTETGFLYYGFRHYSSELGRWLNRDPIGEDGFRAVRSKIKDVHRIRDTQPLRLYVFVENNPLSNVDSHGLESDNLEHQKQWKEEWEEKRRSEILESEFLKWYEENKDISWTKDIQKCPDKIELCEKSGKPRDCTNGKWESIKKADQIYHPTAEWCMRSDTYFGPGQQCCYNKNRDLIVSGLGAGSPSLGSGTPDQWAPSFFNSAYLAHMFADVWPFQAAWELDDGNIGPFLTKYFEVRPPCKGGGKCYE
ncbi:MAG: hypothetical protein GY749_36070 [Desulfobacteraceae bacterium]|nr:hypothetical protein [Desulfobacteraceae bacterium]